MNKEKTEHYIRIVNCSGGRIEYVKKEEFIKKYGSEHISKATIVKIDGEEYAILSKEERIIS